MAALRRKHPQPKELHALHQRLQRKQDEALSASLSLVSRRQRCGVPTLRRSLRGIRLAIDVPFGLKVALRPGGLRLCGDTPQRPGASRFIKTKTRASRGLTQSHQPDLTPE